MPFGKPDVDGVGPDARHPFVIRGLRVWNAHWAFHPVSPSVLVDGLDLYDCEYAVWRPVYDRHAYRGLAMDRITVDREFTPVGKRPAEADYPRPLDPVDDLPPATVITHVTRPAPGKLLVRGTTSDNGAVKRVVVNGTEARAVAANFAEWEAVLEGVNPGELKLKAHAEDAAGNIEKTAHEMMVKVGS